MRLRFVFILLLFLLIEQIPANAQSVAMGLGIVKPGDSRFWITGSYRLNMRDNLYLEPEIGYWKESDSRETCSEILGCIQTKSLLRDINVGLHALFSIPKDPFRLSFGGGLGAHFIKSEGSRIFSPPNPFRPDREESNSDIRPGLHFLAEFDVRVWERFSLFLANRNEFIRKSGDNIKLYGGIRWEL